MTRDDRAVGLEKEEPWAPCCCFVIVTLLFFISNLIKNDLLYNQISAAGDQ